MALAELARLEQPERLVGQVEEPDQVRDRRAAAADAAADLLLAEPEVLDQGGARARLVDGVQVLAGHVLDQRGLQALRLVLVADHAPGPSPRPASRAARQRRSPAISS